MFAFLFRKKDPRTVLNKIDSQSLKEEIKKKHRIDKFNQAVLAVKAKRTGK